jgi:thioredoxin reductase (NADPH)
MAIEEETTDVIIVGGGAAGLSCALWCAELGLTTLLLERDRVFGGQLHLIHNPISNYIGRIASNGTEMLSHFLDSIERSVFTRRLQANVTNIDPLSMTVSMDVGEISAKTIVLATGVRRRKLGVPGEIEFAGKGILESGSRDRESIKGKRVLIVGGGDAAFENALILADGASSVTLVYRGAIPSARVHFQEAASRYRNVEVICDTVVNEVVGTTTVSAVGLENTKTGEKWIEPVDAVLIRIGVDPNSELVRGVVDVDGKQYVKTDDSGMTSQSRIYAIGDIAHPASPTISTAVGTGATVAKVIHASFRGTNRI